MGANSLITRIMIGGVVVSGNTLHLAFRAREGSGVQLVATSVVRT